MKRQIWAYDYEHGFADGITHFELVGMKLDDSKISELMTHLKNTNRPNEIRHMDFRCNNITGVGAVEIAVGVGRYMKQLYLQCNRIGDEGMEKICEVLWENNTLEVLWLGYNNVSARGISSICQLMKKNKSIHCLNLSGNKCGDESMNDISSMLKINSTLRTLLLDNIGITATSVDELMEALEINESLTCLTIDLNPSVMVVNPTGRINAIMLRNKNKIFSAEKLFRMLLEPMNDNVTACADGSM